MTKRIELDLVINGQQARAEISLTNKELQALGLAAQKAGRDAEGMFGSGLGRAVKSAVALGSITAALRSAITTGMNFDAQMDRTGAVVDATREQFDRMRQAARDLGASTIFSASEVAQGMFELGASGMDANETIRATPGLLSAAAAAGMDLSGAAEIMGATLNGFRLEASDASRVADVFAQAANKSAAGMQDLGLTMGYIAPIAAGLGWDLESTTAAIMAMANAGIKGQRAGTTLRGGLDQLLGPSKEAAATMEQIGLKVTDAQGRMLPLPALVGAMNKALEGYNGTQKANILSTIVGTEAQSGFTAMLAEGEKGLKLYEAQLKASKGAADRMAEAMTDNLKGDIEELGGALELLAIELFDTFEGDMRSAVQTGIDLLHDLKDGVKDAKAFLDEWGATIWAGLKALLAINAGTRAYGLVLAASNVNVAQGVIRLVQLAAGYAAATTATVAQAAATEAATVAQTGLNTAMKFSPVGAIIGVVTAVAGAYLLFSESADDAARSLGRVSKQIAKQDGTISTLDRFIKLAREGQTETEEFAGIVDELSGQFPELRSQLSQSTASAITYAQAMREAAAAQREALLEERRAAAHTTVGTVIQSLDEYDDATRRRDANKSWARRPGAVPHMMDPSIEDPSTVPLNRRGAAGAFLKAVEDQRKADEKLREFFRQMGADFSPASMEGAANLRQFAGVTPEQQQRLYMAFNRLGGYNMFAPPPGSTTPTPTPEPAGNRPMPTGSGSDDEQSKEKARRERAAEAQRRLSDKLREARAQAIEDEAAREEAVMQARYAAEREEITQTAAAAKDADNVTAAQKSRIDADAQAARQASEQAEARELSAMRERRRDAAFREREQNQAILDERARASGVAEEVILAGRLERLSVELQAEAEGTERRKSLALEVARVELDLDRAKAERRARLADLDRTAAQQQADADLARLADEDDARIAAMREGAARDRAEMDARLQQRLRAAEAARRRELAEKRATVKDAEQLAKEEALIEQAYDAETADAQRDAARETHELEKRLHEARIAMLRDYLSQVVDVFMQMARARHEERMQQLGAEREAALKAIDAEEEAIGRRGRALTAEERQRLAIQQKRERIEAEFREKERQEKRRMAKAERAHAVLQIALATAVEMAKHGFITPTALAIGAIGAAQAVVAATRPLPEFRKGVTDFEGGLAKVHAGELLVNMAPGTDVLTREQARALLAASSRAPLPGAAGGYGGGLRASDIRAAVRDGLSDVMRPAGAGQVAAFLSQETSRAHRSGRD
jgi:TP901 family phage tail tape measure protein